MDEENTSHHQFISHLNSLANRLSRKLKQNPSQLPVTQLSLLKQLTPNPRTIGQLAELENLSAATVSRCIDKLEEKNLVWRARNKKDRRIVYAVATREAGKLLREQKYLVDFNFDDKLKLLSEAEISRLSRAITELNALLAN